MKKMEKTKTILVSWVGNKDVQAAIDRTRHDNQQAASMGEYGPLRTLTDDRYFDILYLLYTDDKENRLTESEALRRWVLKGSKNRAIQIELVRTSVKDPTDHTEIFTALGTFLKPLREKYPKDDFTFHLTPGTSAMHAVMLSVSKDSFNSEAVRTVEKKYANAENKQIFTVHFPLKQCEDNKPFLAISLEEQRLLFGRVASAHSVNVLILGETGVGKSEIANQVHKTSLRKGAFVPINCAGLTQSIVESELFGHKKGAYTGADADKKGVFEQANGGTLFLDEVGELPLSVQAKLLRVIETGMVRPLGSEKEQKIDVRLICATNKNLVEEMAKQGTFRQDLYYRIAGYEVLMKPFREYKNEDKESIVTTFIEEANKKLANRSVPVRLEEGGEAMRLLCQHNWPGNLRQLKSVLFRLCLLEDGYILRASGIAKYLETQSQPASKMTDSTAITICAKYTNHAIEERLSLTSMLHKVKHQAIEQAMAISKNKKTAAAKLLGIDIQKLNYDLKKRDLELEEMERNNKNSQIQNTNK